MLRPSHPICSPNPLLFSLENPCAGVNLSTRRRPPRPDHRRNGSDGRYRVRLPPAHAASGTSVPAAPPTRLSASAELCLCRADAGCPASARRGASGPRADGAAAAAALKAGAPQVQHAFACPCLLCMLCHLHASCAPHIHFFGPGADISCTIFYTPQMCP